jgi:hypothetical protein
MTLRTAFLIFGDVLPLTNSLPLIAGELSPKREAEAMKMLVATHANQRRKAHQALAQLGDDTEATSKRLIAKAKRHHQQHCKRPRPCWSPFRKPTKRGRCRQKERWNGQVRI